MTMTIEERLEAMRREQCVICPHCGHEHEPSGDDWECFQDGLISYHGSEDGPVEFECVACEKTIWVDEQVERTWKAYAEKPDPYDY